MSGVNIHRFSLDSAVSSDHAMSWLELCEYNRIFLLESSCTFPSMREFLHDWLKYRVSIY